MSSVVASMHTGAVLGPILSELVSANSSQMVVPAALVSWQAGVDARFFDVHFTTLIRDPLATVSAIYDRFGLTLTSEARTSMQRWLDDPSGRTPKGQHTLQQYQLDEAIIDRHFGPYIAHYGIERERRS